MEKTEETGVARIDNFKAVLAREYRKQIDNYFGSEKEALRFLSSVVSAVQRQPKLLDCEPASLINSILTMAQLRFLPSGISGEAYIIPYANSKKNFETGAYAKVLEAQFQMGYQGFVTLLYRAGARNVVSEIVFEKDRFRVVNGEITHEPDIFAEDRGKAIGAYSIITMSTGGSVSKVMTAAQIEAHGKRFSKSYGDKYSPWNPVNDPERWMWKKTVIKQAVKLAAKNDDLNGAIAADNEADTDLSRERADKAILESRKLRMGALLKQEEAPEAEEIPNEKLPEIDIDEQ